jgi:hypothetical protein
LKVDSRALEGIERKITRADEHLTVLDGEMHSWLDDGPDRAWGLFPEAHDEGRKHFYRLRYARPIPIDWAVTLGEAIHDLRSALDQAVYWLTVDWGGKPLKGSQFPVYRRKANFEEQRKSGDWSSSGGMYKIRGIGPGPQAFIEALQPYPQRYRRAFSRDLWTVHNLWNHDKHRLVHLWGIRFSNELMAVRQDMAADCVIGIDRRVLHDRAIVLRITCDPPHSEVHMRGEVSAGLTIYAGKGRGGNLKLRDIASTVADVIRKLTNAIGQQDRSINLDVWTIKGQ